VPDKAGFRHLSLRVPTHLNTDLSSVFGQRPLRPDTGIRRVGVSSEIIKGLPRFAMAFQPIADTMTGTVFAQEALARGRDGEGAASVFDKVPLSKRHLFESICRQRALEAVREMGTNGARISLNVSPEAVLDQEFGICETIRAARTLGLHERQLILELTEKQKASDVRAIRDLIIPFRKRGMMVALDDFGAGYNGIQTLLDLKPDVVKFDMGLINRIDTCEMQQTLISSLAEACSRLDIIVVAEGVETLPQARMLQSIGIALMQGYLFARPMVGLLPTPAPDIMARLM
jgi:EAL domain-containing protein (putative c-di-GMP-specific phosphodiesterase class I)